MPKIKSNRGAKKRFKVTGSGQIKCGSAFRSHILTSKGTKRKRHLRDTAYVDKADIKNVKKMIPYD